MKKFITLFLLFFTFAEIVSSSTQEVIAPRISIISSNIYKVEKKKFDLYYEFYKDRIPEKYLEAFLKATKDSIELRNILYSMMLLESQEFTAYENLNKNGTTDHGPLMLNSANIRNSEFKKLYFPKDEFFSNLTNTDKNDDYTIYMIACINLFKHHMEKYSLENSMRAYNAGPRILKAERWNSRVAHSFRYAKRALKYLENTQKEFEEFKNEYSSDDLYSIIIR